MNEPAATTAVGGGAAQVGAQPASAGPRPRPALERHAAEQEDALMRFARSAYEAFHDGTPPLPWVQMTGLSQLKWVNAARAVVARYQGHCSEVRS